MSAAHAHHGHGHGNQHHALPRGLNLLLAIILGMSAIATGVIAWHANVLAGHATEDFTLSTQAGGAFAAPVCRLPCASTTVTVSGIAAPAVVEVPAESCSATAVDIFV